MAVRGPEEFDGAFAAMARERAEALLVGRDATFLVNRARVAERALKGRLPTMYSYRESVEVGGLMAYAVNMTDFIARAASYVDKILLSGASTAVRHQFTASIGFIGFQPAMMRCWRRWRYVGHSLSHFGTGHGRIGRH